MSAPAVGTRLRCAKCGTEIIVVKAPTGPLSCCDQEMGARDADQERSEAPPGAAHTSGSESDPTAQEAAGAQ